jgi:hypothetical protein
MVQFSRHSEIGHFDDSVIGQKDITGRQIAMKNLPQLRKL